MELYDLYGAEILLDKVDENQTNQKAMKQKKSSGFLTFTKAVVEEKISKLEKKISTTPTDPTSEEISVSQSSLDLANKALARLKQIETEILG